MARLRYNGLTAALGGAGLGSGDTTVTFAAALAHSGGTAVATIASPDYLPLTILDATGAVKEIVYLTAYTSSATTGTISRAQEGTSAAFHPAGTTVAHGPTVADFAGSDGVMVTAELPAAAANPERLAVLETPPVAASGPMLGADGLHPTDAGMTYLADQYEAALATAGKTPSAGTTMVAYGDSWTAQDIENTPGQRAIVQLASRLGTSLTNRAVGGYLAGDIAACAIGTNPFTPESAPLAVVPNAGLNDLSKTDTAQQRTATEAYLRALFATLSAAERIEQTAFTYSGTWSTTTNALPVASGGSCAIANSNDDVATYTITTPGTYYLLLFGSDGVAPVCGQITVSQGGTTLASIDGNQKHVNTGNLLTAGYGPLALRLNGVTAGTLTINYDTLGRASSSGFPDALLRMSDTPPTILAVKPVEVTASTHNKPAVLTYIRGLYDTLAAEFGSHVVVCDPAPGWAPAGTAGTAGASPSLWFSDGSTWQQPTADVGTAAAVDVTFAPTGDLAATDVQAALAELDSEKIASSQKGAADGVASLGADGKVPSAQLPAASAPGITVQDENGEIATGVTQIDFQGAGITAATGTGEIVVTVPGSTGGTSIKDRRWTVPSGATSIDEFNDGSQDAAWVRVDGSGAPASAVTWTEAGDVISALHTGGDAASTIHALVRPVSTVAVGDAFVAFINLMGQNVNYAVSGIVLSDGTTFGAGKQVAAVTYRGAAADRTTAAQAYTNWANTAAAGTLTTGTDSGFYLRLVQVTSTTWRADISPDGVSWIKGDATVSQTITPTHVGLLLSSWGSTKPFVASHEFLRRYAGIS